MKLTSYPHLVKEWHPTKNGDLTPNDLTHGSHTKIWWLCLKGHSYNSVIKERTNKNKPTGCPYCDGKKASKENNLLTVFPEIAKEWHPTENNELTPKDVTSKSDKKVWWLCLKEHSYKATIKNKTLKKSGCPYCSNKKASETNNLQVMFPEIAKEWHPTKNKGLSPEDFTYGSHKEVWWLCPKGHTYKTTVNTRTNQKSGCNICSKKSSEPEIRILSELKWFFDDIKNRYKLDGVEIDIYVPKFNLGIEYDGNYFHKNRKDKDLEKNKFLLSQNITLIRVREHPLKLLSENDLIVKAPLEKVNLDEILKKIYPFVDNKIKEQINTYLDKPSFINEEVYRKYRSYFPSPFPENSLLKTHPLISSEWDYDKNYPLRPENFSYGSRNKFWWLCSKDHSYESPIINRTSRRFGCPYCSGHKVGEDNNLLVLFPEIAKEWHPTKNGELTPDDFTRGSNKKVWWLCNKSHSYEQRINDRTGKQQQGCPYCAGKKTLNYDLFK